MKMSVWVWVARTVPEMFIHPIFREVYEDLMTYPEKYHFTKTSLVGRATKKQVEVRIKLSRWITGSTIEMENLTFIHLRYGIGHKVRLFKLNRIEKKKLAEALNLRMKWGEDTRKGVRG